MRDQLEVQLIGSEIPWPTSRSHTAGDDVLWAGTPDADCQSEAVVPVGKAWTIRRVEVIDLRTGQLRGAQDFVKDGRPAPRLAAAPEAVYVVLSACPDGTIKPHLSVRRTP